MDNLIVARCCIVGTHVDFTTTCTAKDSKYYILNKINSNKQKVTKTLLLSVILLCLKQSQADPPWCWLHKKSIVIAVYLGQVHEVLGLATDSRGFEFDMGFVVGTVLHANRKGACGRVGYGGWLGVIGYVL